ncbi:MAG: glycosyltransferase [Planctomycetota bacterium]
MTALVVVDATPLGPEPSGARRRMEAILPRLAARLPDAVLEVHWARDGGGPGPGVSAANLVHATVDVSCRGGARRMVRVARHLRRRHRQAAFTHLLVDHGPVPLASRVRVVVTVHDLRFLHGWGGVLRGLYGRLRYGRLLERAGAVVAVAPSVAAEVERCYPALEGRVLVAANAPSPAFGPPAPDAPRRGALVVARDEPRKAREAALWAARAAGLPVTVIDGAVSEASLREAYRRARWVLAPSLEEGYDLPVAEALASGTPVVASDIPAHRDLEALGAEGLVLVPPPVRGRHGWSWPGAVEALAADLPARVGPPAGTWEDAAAVLAEAVGGSRPPG